MLYIQEKIDNMTNNYKFISVHEIASRVKRHPLLKDMSFEHIIQCTVDFISIVGLPTTFKEKGETIKIENYRAQLPCDLIDIMFVKDNSTGITLRNTTDVHIVRKGKHYISNDTDRTFRLVGNIIYTSFKKGEIDIVYKSMPVDENNFPLLPDDPTFQVALELYIRVEYFTILFDLGKISQQSLYNTQQQYSFRVGQLKTSYNIPTLSEMESISNMLTSLIPRNNEFRKGFKNLGTKEHFKTH